MRSVVLVVLCELYSRIMGPRQNLLVVLVVCVYCDAHSWRHDKLNRALGFLCPVALCILSTTDVTHCSALLAIDRSLAAQVVYWTVQVVWPLLASYYLAVLGFIDVNNFKKPNEATLAAAGMFCLTMHCVLLMSSHQTTAEVMVRSVLYYTAGMLFYYSKSKLPSVDRNTHNWMAMHVCIHLLFVDVYVLIASVVVLGGLIWGLFFHHKRPASFLSVPDKPTASASHSVVVVADDAVIQQLRAAQALRTLEA